MLFGCQLTEITNADVQGILASRAHRDAQFEFREALPGPEDSEKRAFLEDACAMANGTGGDIVFGLEEECDVHGRPTGVVQALVGVKGNPDEEIRRLKRLLETGLDPALMPKAQVQLLMAKPPLIIVRIPKSRAGPHMVRDDRFYMRRGASNQPMDSAALRVAFAATEGWGERVRKFRETRAMQILRDELPEPMCGRERLVVHLLPCSVLVPDITVNLSVIKQANPRPINDYGWWLRFNVDGLCAITGASSGLCHSYVQFFRNGPVEAVVYVGGLQSSRRMLWLSELEKIILQAVRSYPPIVLDAGGALPFAVVVSLVGVKDMQAIAHRSETEGPKPIGRDVLFLSERILPDITGELSITLKPLFDHLSQACGYERSASYDEHGLWSREW